VSSTVAEAVRALTAGYTLEVTPKQVERVGALRGLLAEGSGVYITAIPGAPHSQLIDAAERIASEGFRPIAHIAARGYRDLAEVDSLLGSLRLRARATEVLVIAGSLPRPVGSIDSSIQILRSGLLEQHGIRRVGVAGHPEGHPNIAADALAQAVEAKNRFAAESGLDTYILTQFCFAAEPYIRYERELRMAGNRLPVRPGLPGVTSMHTLLKFGISCGIGPSLRILRKQARRLSTFISPHPYTPDTLITELATAAAAEPDSLLGSLHFYPFGGLEATARWITSLTAETTTHPPRTTE